MKVLLLALLAALIIVPAASAGHIKAAMNGPSGAYAVGTFCNTDTPPACNTFPAFSSGQVWLRYDLAGFPDSGAPYTITDTVTCDNGFSGSIVYGGGNRGFDTFATGAANCTAVLSYTHANKSPVVLDTISFTVPS